MIFEETIVLEDLEEEEILKYEHISVNSECYSKFKDQDEADYHPPKKACQQPATCPSCSIGCVGYIDFFI